MNKSASVTIFLTIVTFFSFHHSYAADSTANKSTAAVLVQLTTEHNRIQAMTGAKKYEDVNEVKRDAAGVNNTMKKDFRDHFTLCPVYYFVDTNRELIKQKLFSGVLLDADGTPAKKIVLNENSKNYFIVYYGYPEPQSRKTRTVTHSGSSKNDSEDPMGKGLVINNSSFDQVGFFYKFGYDDVFLKRKRNKGYIYNSKHYDIEYYPFAAELNKKLKEHNDKIRITHVNGFTDEMFDKKK